MAGTGVRVTVFASQAIAEARAGLVPALTEVAQLIVDDARSSAPVETGEFQTSIAVSTIGDKVYAEASDPVAFYIEYGTSDTPAHATMTNAARKHGKYSGMTPR